MNPLSEKDLAYIKQHAENEAPLACCGVLTANGAIRCVNIAKDRTVHVLIESQQLYHIAKRNKITGFYCSRINGNAEATENFSGPLYAGLHYVIVNVSMRFGGKVTHAAGYELQNTATGNKLVRQWNV